MGSSNQREKFDMNILVCGNYISNNLLNWLIGNTKLNYHYESISDNLYKVMNHPSLHWTYYILNGLLSENKINSFPSFVRGHPNCVILYIMDSYEDPFFLSLLSNYSKVNQIYHPFFLFSVRGKKENFDIDYILNQENFNIDKRNIIITQYDEQNHMEIMKNLLQFCSYYNELGDSFSFPNTSGETTIFDDNQSVVSSKDKKYTFQRYHPNFLVTMNIFIAGRPGVGKSTFINLFLGEKRAKENKGKAVTSRIIKYNHQQYPIAIYDTPGFESRESITKVIEEIKKYNITFLEGKDQIHCIFFLINSESGRTLFDDDFYFIEEIEKMKIKMFYIITKCKTQQRGDIFKDSLKVSLSSSSRSLGNDYSIFSVNLLNEKEDNEMIKVQSFGLGQLFNDIYLHYKKDKVNIEKINKVDIKEENYFIQIQEIIEKSRFFKYIKKIEDIIEFAGSKAKYIIISYSVLAGLIGASPIPFADWYLLFPIQASMVFALAGLYHIFKTKDEISSLIKSLSINLVLSGIGRGIASGLKLIPGLGTIFGGFMDSTISSWGTSAIGFACKAFFEKELQSIGLVKYISLLAECLNKAVDSFLDISTKFNW